MSKIEYIKAANEIAKLIVSQANGAETLADQMLAALGTAEQSGMDLNTVWASIAETNGWSDRDAKLDGNPMPKTLANYRSLSRKAMALGVDHIGRFADWRKLIAKEDKLRKAAQEEQTPRIESLNLNEIELPSWVERANQARQVMTVENIAAFDKYIHHHIEAFMNKKVK